MNILIGGAWPYANGSLHLGHIAALLPGDVIARYYREKGDEVLYVSGSDCHGTPIAIRAKNEKVAPSEITDKYHKEFKYCFDKLGFSYDYYSRTDDEYHKKEIQKIVKKLYENGFIYEKEVEQLYCEHCNQFLPDRYVEGTCPVCGSKARGDQCDSCQTILDPLELNNRRCKLCGEEPVVKSGKQLYFALSKFQKKLEEYFKEVKNGWRLNAINNTERYLKEGLQDRAISRNLDWGIDVPIEGYEDKKIYVWIDAVLGYLTVSKKWGEENNKAWEKFWQKDAISYYIHGKDNIPFHTVILPALLSGIGIEKLPGKVISSEYVTLEGQKISTSNNWAVWAPDIIESYNPDAIRYFFIANAPERRDTDFSFREFLKKNNNELLGAYGNLVNRTLVFAKKYFDNLVPIGKEDETLKNAILGLYANVGKKIEQGELKSAIDEVFEFVRGVNKYFDENTPWVTVKEDKEACGNSIYNCLNAIANLANILEPFLPFSSKKIKNWLVYNVDKFEYKALACGKQIGEFEILFERLDKGIVDEELQKLKGV
ncbi:methionine--tRNA ligase [Clostridium hydrogenum]|uniref:methionine--tRNA ligase n=1 Tax=Clostridium hydrogenum TaxID=2855764 RepID=UPI001F1812DE|nr:methionine--tRNA ligase [Clostridium hydrogenum]